MTKSLLKKSKTLLIVALSFITIAALALAFASMPARSVDVIATGEEDFGTVGMSATLNEDIVLTFTMGAGGYTDAVAEISFLGKNERIKASAYESNFSFSFDKVTPQNISEDVVLTVNAGEDGEGDLIARKTVSLENYLRGVIAAAEASDPSRKNDEDVAVCKDLLNYGRAAQAYCDKTVEYDAVIGTSVTIDDTPANEIVDVTDLQGATSEDAIKWQSARLYFDKNVTITYKFSYTGNIEEDAVSVSLIKEGEVAVTIDEFTSYGEGVYGFDYEDIMPTEFYKTITTSFKIDNVATGGTLVYSVNSYIRRILAGDGSENSKALVSALAAYGKSANAIANRGTLYTATTAPTLDSAGVISLTANGYNYSKALPAFNKTDYNKTWAFAPSWDGNYMLTENGTFSFDWNTTGYVGTFTGEAIDKLIFVNTESPHAYDITDLRSAGVLGSEEINGEINLNLENVTNVSNIVITNVKTKINVSGANTLSGQIKYYGNVAYGLTVSGGDKDDDTLTVGRIKSDASLKLDCVSVSIAATNNALEANGSLEIVDSAVTAINTSDSKAGTALGAYGGVLTVDNSTVETTNYINGIYSGVAMTLTLNNQASITFNNGSNGVNVSSLALGENFEGTITQSGLSNGLNLSSLTVPVGAELHFVDTDHTTVIGDLTVNGIIKFDIKTLRASNLNVGTVDGATGAKLHVQSREWGIDTSDSFVNVTLERGEIFMNSANIHNYAAFKKIGKFICNQYSKLYVKSYAKCIYEIDWDHLQDGIYESDVYYVYDISDIDPYFAQKRTTAASEAEFPAFNLDFAA